MKTKFITLLITALILAGTGCTKPAPDNDPSAENTTGPVSPSPEKKDNGYCFIYNGVEIILGEKADGIIASLGEPNGVFESPSCAFEGIDKIFYYNGFLINTYPDSGEDYILSVSLTDDSLKTPEGIMLGMALDDVLNAYGDGYKNELGMYTYTLENTELSFLIEDGAVVDITYYFIY